MRKLSFFCSFVSIFILGLCSSLAISAQSLSENSTVSLLTISPGEELWSFAGHTAIRVKDPVNGIDVNFNYGTFDFRKENFYFKFLRGTLPYEIGAANYRQETPYWLREERFVTEQVLDLSLGQKQKLFDYLIENYKPENREYRYKFFYDNCSTRVRDVISEACGDSLKFSTSLHADSTYRDWIKKYSQISHNDWAEFGMDLLIGVPADETTGWAQAMYIPDNLMMAVDSASIQKNGKWGKLVKQRFVIGSTDHQTESLPIKPTVFFFLVFVLVGVLTFIELRSGKWFILFDKILFSLIGLSGLIFFFLWFFTDHGVTSWNLNLLWAFPIWFPTVWFLKRTQSQNLLTKLFLAQAISAAVVVLGFKILPQTFHLAVWPIAAIVLSRSLLIWKRKS
ncbi:DUF4105 domain-containing protein [Marinilongibacter aquaticus]|uniref:Lnb N-terminal periplasmic domain-containing protein n=1 Tax=Marinilongibacter aquaticus TaxID=2975157 RepID=UPI0021BD0C2B|nr:DUF4105 domain-containing protein [Marinilongibacter aquaticus]UBM59406.1 DUF4105 domain-containing protein [Marinilongibacter aquaticus]